MKVGRRRPFNAATEFRFCASAEAWRDAGRRRSGMDNAIVEQIRNAVKLYGEWADRTGDYPHDEAGCIAHDAIVEVYRVLARDAG